MSLDDGLPASPMRLLRVCPEEVVLLDVQWWRGRFIVVLPLRHARTGRQSVSGGTRGSDGGSGGGHLERFEAGLPLGRE